MATDTENRVEVRFDIPEGHRAFLRWYADIVGQSMTEVVRQQIEELHERVSTSDPRAPRL